MKTKISPYATPWRNSCQREGMRVLLCFFEYRADLFLCMGSVSETNVPVAPARQNSLPMWSTRKERKKTQVSASRVQLRTRNCQPSFQDLRLDRHVPKQARPAADGPSLACVCVVARNDNDRVEYSVIEASEPVSDTGKPCALACLSIYGYLSREGEN